MSLIELGKEFSRCRKQHDEIKKRLEEATDEWDEVEKKLIEAMIEEGVNSVAIDGVGHLSLVTKNHLSVNQANQPRFYEYLKASGNGALLKEYVAPKTLTAFLGKHLEEMITDRQSQGEDLVTARQHALNFLNDQGASYFSQRTISMRKE